MLCNIYFTKNQTYISLNLEDFGFNDILNLFEAGDETLKQLTRQNEIVFNEIVSKYIFIKSGNFLLNILSYIYQEKVTVNDMIIFEIEDHLYHTKTNEFVVFLLEGLIASNKHNINVSQKVLISLTNKQFNDE